MVDLCAAADAGADAMAPLSLSRMAPDPSRHARAVPGAGLPRRGARARRLLDRHHRPAARPAAGGRRLERRRGAGRPHRPRSPQPRTHHGAGAQARRRAGSRMPPGRGLARPPGGTVRLRALRPPRGRASVHHRQRAQAGWRHPLRNQGAGRLHLAASRRAARGPAGGGRRTLRLLPARRRRGRAASLGSGRHRRHALPGLVGHPGRRPDPCAQRETALLRARRGRRSLRRHAAGTLRGPALDPAEHP